MYPGNISIYIQDTRIFIYRKHDCYHHGDEHEVPSQHDEQLPGLPGAGGPDHPALLLPPGDHLLPYAGGQVSWSIKSTYRTYD